MAFKSPALLSLGDAQSPPQAAQATAAAATAARTDSQGWDEGEQRLPSARADSAPPHPPPPERWGLGGIPPSPPLPIAHRKMNWQEVRREGCSALSWIGNQWAGARSARSRKGRNPASTAAGVPGSFHCTAPAVVSWGSEERRARWRRTSLGH